VRKQAISRLPGKSPIALTSSATALKYSQPTDKMLKYKNSDPVFLMMQKAELFVSVIMPTLSSGETLEACLRGIIVQTMPFDRYAIALADAGSSD
jgi:hypothetical protein